MHPRFILDVLVELCVTHKPQKTGIGYAAGKEKHSELLQRLITPEKTKPFFLYTLIFVFSVKIKFKTI